MARDPTKTDEIRIYCTPETKSRWNAWSTFFDDNQEALLTLLDVKDENQELFDFYR